MNWINIHTSTISSPEFKGAEDYEQAAWILLLAWCCDQENSGVITGAKEWKPKKWQTVCGVSHKVVMEESELYHFDGDDLHVHFYPIEHQDKAKTSRENGKRGGRPKKTQQDTQDKPSGIPSGVPKSNPDPNPNINKNNIRELNKMKQECESKESKPTQQDVVDYLLSKMPDVNPEWTPDRINRAGASLYENWLENKWRDGNNKPIVNWKLKAKNAVIHYKPWNFGSTQQTSTPQTSFRI